MRGELILRMTISQKIHFSDDQSSAEINQQISALLTVNSGRVKGNN
jgi:hypothetical protein